MHAEREELIKHVFPELRRRCRERGVEFTEVDLRWGVTEERSHRGEVLPICLAEIDRCHPFFICHLGERYGWVPDEISPELLESQPWLKGHRGKSVTELEIIRGVLESPRENCNAFFYLRDPLLSRAVEEQLAADPDYLPEPPESAAKLAELKHSIRRSGYPHTDYSDLKTFRAQVLEDLWSSIEREFPLEEVPSWLEREWMEHEAFAEARRKTYIGRENYFHLLNDHVAGSGRPLVVVGESGAGKSALLANWVEAYRREHPNDFLIARFIGGTLDSADYVSLLRGIMEEIKERYRPASARDDEEEEAHTIGIELEAGEIPTDPKRVKEAFPVWLLKAETEEARDGRRFILVLDGLNQLDDRDNAPDLFWLPMALSPTIRLILSSLPGRSLEALHKRVWPTMHIERLEPAERERFVVEYLRRFGKELDLECRRRIVAAEQCANPLFLRTLLEELRVFGAHQELAEKVGHYLEADSAEALFVKVLERFEQDYEREEDGTIGLTRDAMSLIWASRNGLTEEELLELLGRRNEPLAKAYWSPIHLAAEESLVNRSGLLSFFHHFMRLAVEQRYLAGSDEKRVWHTRIADQFTPKPFSERRVDELPWQLAEAGRLSGEQEMDVWRRLKACIVEPKTFLHLYCDEREYELTGYWLAIGDRFDMVRAYHGAIAQHKYDQGDDGRFAYLLSQVAGFLYLNARHKGAEPLYRRALRLDEAAFGPGSPRVARRLNNLAALLRTTGRHQEAEPLYHRALKIEEAAHGPDHPKVARVLNNLAELLNATCRYADAEPLYRRALRITEACYGSSHPKVAIRLNNLAELLRATNRFQEADPLYRRALPIDEASYGPDHPNVAADLNNLAGLYYATNRFERAEPLYRRALRINEVGFGPNHPSVAISLNNLGVLLFQMHNLHGAGDAIRRAHRIFRRSLGQNHPNTLTAKAWIEQIELRQNEPMVDEESLFWAQDSQSTLTRWTI